MRNGREHMLKILRRQVAGEVPMALELDRHAYHRYAGQLGGKTAGDYFDLWHRYVRLNEDAGRQAVRFERYYPSLPAEAKIDCWGCAKVENEREAVRHYYPLGSAERPEDVDAYPFPDFYRAECREGLKARVEDLHGRGLVVIGATSRVVFPMCWHLRGMEEFFVDLAERPEIAGRLLDRVTEAQLGIVDGLARAGVDVLWLGIDVAAQTTTFISPRMWADWIKPRMRRLFDYARSLRPDILAAVHCCGAVTPILDHLVDLGVEILNPVQPESIDLEDVKRRYGERMTFWGGVSIQNTLPRGTPEQVRAEVRERVRVLGRNGGYVVCPAHHLTHDVPWENVLAFVDEASRARRQA